MFEKPESGISRWNKALPLEIPQKKFIRSLGNSARPKSKTPGNSTLFFLGHPWKFCFLFNQPLEIPHAISLISLSLHSVQPPFCRCGLSLQPNFQKGGGLTGPRLLEGVARKEGVTFFRGSCSCHIKMN